MDGRARLISVLAGLVALAVTACIAPSPPTTYDIPLSTMGTTGIVRVVTNHPSDTIGLSARIDDLLIEVNDEMSTYIPASTISRFNASADSVTDLSATVHMRHVLRLAQGIHDTTDGAFDPTIMPLVRYWGFAGGEAPADVDSALVDSIRARVGMDRLELVDDANDGFALRRRTPGIELDLSAIAKGHGVDAVSDLLTARGLTDHMVEIGGEVRCSGRTEAGTVWRIGIERPDIDERGLYAAVPVDQAGMATSGNYRNVRTMAGGRTVWHTIDPVTGYPVERDVLSATVIAPTCALADGLATACMVLGSVPCLDVLRSMDDVEGLLILGDADGGLCHAANGGLSRGAGVGMRMETTGAVISRWTAGRGHRPGCLRTCSGHHRRPYTHRSRCAASDCCSHSPRGTRRRA